MRVLVVGATGAVGRQLVPKLARAGHQVVAAARRTPDAAIDNVEYATLDLLDSSSARRLVQDVEPDAIVHQATALTGLGNNLRRFDAWFETTNRLRTEGTESLIKAASSLDRRPRLIIQSFCGWPWAPTGGPIKTETDALDPNPAPSFRRTFAAIKRLEELVSAYPGGVALRYGALYGPETSLTLGGAQIEAIRKRQFPLVGPATGVWSFLHVSDAAGAAIAALETGSGTYNIVDDEPVPVSTFLPELATMLDAPPPRRIPVWLARLAGGRGLVHMMVTARGSSNAKARAELGWKPEHPSWRTGFAGELGTSQAAP
jgi:nucleoside-diphosphate-sugar epimerase